VNVNLIVIFKCVSLKYLNINISARAASVAVSGGHTGERRACLCVCVSILSYSHIQNVRRARKRRFCSRLARIYHQKECVSRGREPVLSRKKLDVHISVARKKRPN
jgi:hypothetical protein